PGSRLCPYATLFRSSLRLLREWPQRLKSITDDTTEYQVRGKAIRVENYRESLSHQKIPKIAAPTYRSWGELLTFLGKENLPGSRSEEHTSELQSRDE